MCGSKGTATSTSTYSPPADVQANYDQLAAQAKQVAATPFTPYTGEMVAGLTPSQTAGIQNVNSSAATAQPYYQAATGLVGNAAQTFGQPQLDQYMSPYINSVANATQANLNETNAQQQQQLLGNAISQGAFGGDRAGIAQAELARQQGLSNGQTMANVYQGGYGQALAQFNADQSRQLQAGSTLGQLGTGAQTAGLQGGQAQMAAGATQQAVQQAQDVANQQQFQAQQAYPFQTTQYLANLLLGIGGQSGGTALTAQPQGNIGSSLVGGLLTAGSLFKPFNKGGVVPHDDSMGGAVNEGDDRKGYALSGGVDSQYGVDIPYSDQPTGGSSKPLSLADVMRVRHLGRSSPGWSTKPSAPSLSDQGEIDPNKVLSQAMANPSQKSNLSGWANKLIGNTPGTVSTADLLSAYQNQMPQPTLSQVQPYESGGVVGRHGYAEDGFVPDPTVSDYAGRSATVGENIGTILENLNRAPSYEGRGKTVGEALYGAPLSDEANMGLLSAGLAMMGNKSPIFGIGVGQGAQAGLGTYYNALKNKRDYTQKLMEDQEKAYGTAAENAYRSSMLPIDQTRASADVTRANAEALTSGTTAFDKVRGFYSIGDAVQNPDPAHPEGYVVGPGGTHLSFDQYRQAMAAHLQNMGVFNPNVVKVLSDPTLLGTSPSPATPKSRGGEMSEDNLNKLPSDKPDTIGASVDKPVQVAQAAPATITDVPPDASGKKAEASINPLTDYDKLAEQAYNRYKYASAHPEFANSADLAKKAMEDYKTYSTLSPTIQAQAREFEAKKNEANKLAEGSAQTQTTFNNEANEYLSSYSNQLMQLQTLSKISQLAELNRLSDIKANFAGFLRELGVDHIGPFDLGNIESANDTSLKNAVMQAFSEVGQSGLSRAPNAALGAAMKTVADPKVAPGTKYNLITQEMAKATRKKQKYEDWYDAGQPNVGKFSKDWEKDPAHSSKIFLQQAVDENPYFAGMTEDEKKQLLAQRKSVFDTSEDVEGAPTAPAAPTGQKRMKFNPETGNIE